MEFSWSLFGCLLSTSWRGMQPFSLILEDGSRLEEVSIRHGRMTPGK